MLRMYSVYDSKTKNYGRPVVFRSDGELVRTFKEILTPGSERQPNNFTKFPDDYALMHIGNWDDESGSIDPVTPRLVFNVRELVSEPSLALEKEAQ